MSVPARVSLATLGVGDGSCWRSTWEVTHDPGWPLDETRVPRLP
ncbi:hypothetical protein EV385_4693 [Krasilnikovia cinnamomea]|uniref:Uncharacterized protein n=1 Tax=Krasilnikovia cinnamomea TaxID=349313 RepID=A0A4Q7ZQY9_9ACTN|nr:hypothetical protein [Krasilnikovia cinnamomea]RZU52809.1 hypothetical protein EV385_4693 [Krasilnikovia cinnamomea]